MQIFHTNCTSPETVGFVAAPNTRGTLDIVWTCLSVIGLCTWSILHLNVPIQSSPSRKRQKYIRELWRFSKKLKWMIVNILAPEWAFGMACSNVCSVRILRGRYAQYQEADGVPWTDSHIHYANMGGFPIQFANSDSVTDPQEIPLLRDFPKGIRTPQRLQQSMQKISNAIGKVDWELDRSNILAIQEANNMVSRGYFKDGKPFNMPYREWAGNLTLLCGNLWVVDANQLLLAREFGIIDKLPSLSRDALDALNKGDMGVKLLALLQISWMFIQLGVRLARNLPTSQLEIFTLSFALCSSITHILLISKVQNSQTACVVKASRHPSAEELIYLANAGPLASGPRYSVWIPNDAFHRDVLKKRPGYVMTLGCLCSLLLLGAVQCIAWNFDFPTDLERIFWRLSSIITAVAFPFLYFCSQLLDPIWIKAFKLESQPRLVQWLETVLIFHGVIVFILARLFITVEVVRSLAFLPPGAFTSTWATNIPHVG